MIFHVMHLRKVCAVKFDAARPITNSVDPSHLVKPLGRSAPFTVPELPITNFTPSDARCTSN